VAAWALIAFAYDGFVLNYKPDGQKLKWWEKIIMGPFFIIFGLQVDRME
jgi:hypothetical protein